MSSLEVKPASSCRWDVVSLGEVMLRLDPGDRRISTTRSFDVWEGGGEYNVARGLRRCFERRASVVTALADNPVGRLLEDLILQGGVDSSHIVWKPYDGVGHALRNGLNFVERGFGVRPAQGCSDRGHSAASMLAPEDISLEKLFEQEGTRWLHTGGIFAALGDETPTVADAVMRRARESGARVSYDLNYRHSLWKSRGGKDAARAANRSLVPHVDVLFGNEEDFHAALGFEIEGTTDSYDVLNTEAFRKMILKVVDAYPQLKVVATTLRTAHTASLNGWGAICFDVQMGEFFEVPQKDIAIFDRVGGGDSFASGMIEGFLSEKGSEWALRCGVAHGALAMTTPGDTTMATFPEVLRVMDGQSARIDR